ncbi:hypothetical protein OHT59_40505 [Streptomyces sp. NBC_00243]|uniref:hypothetical protein n=1 Tax=Streptomyces sp. NBC_00243 TaxID=2975688 RepID=UPI002DDAD4CC|nr:hypothetical protein [Streptomyces sp. NBC_00243]WRZ24355.1 hypothetical protein OHT59_40505 [Streptomyces sp. NBC_00243]
MTHEDLAPATGCQVATAELITLDATVSQIDEAIAANEREQAALDRMEAASPELERLERLYPGRPTTQNMLDDAGVSRADLGLEESDLALIDEMLVPITGDVEPQEWTMR